LTVTSAAESLSVPQRRNRQVPAGRIHQKIDPGDQIKKLIRTESGLDDADNIGQRPEITAWSFGAQGCGPQVTTRLCLAWQCLRLTLFPPTSLGPLDFQKQVTGGPHASGEGLRPRARFPAFPLRLRADAAAISGFPVLSSERLWHSTKRDISIRETSTFPNTRSGPEKQSGERSAYQASLQKARTAKTHCISKQLYEGATSGGSAKDALPPKSATSGATELQ
jgi:hypothetical protein